MVEDLLGHFKGSHLKGRYWTVLHDASQPFVLKIANRPESRGSLGFRAAADYEIMHHFLERHLPWQCVLTLPCSGRGTFLILQDLVRADYHLGYESDMELTRSAPLIREALHNDAIRRELLRLAQGIMLMHKVTLAVPDLLGDSNVLVNRSAAMLVDTNVLYSPAEESRMGRKGFFQVCELINELLWLLGDDGCLQAQSASRASFSLPYGSS